MRRWIGLCLIVAGCSRSCACGDASLAELAAKDGQVDRDFARAIERWIAADVGAQFATGDAVRTGDAASARLHLAGGGGLDLKSGTLIRFLAEAPGSRSPRVRIESGVAEVEAGAGELGIETKRGGARLPRGARARIALDADGNARLEVLLGSAVIEGADTASAGAVRFLGGVAPVAPDAGAAVLEPVARVDGASRSLAIHGAEEPLPIAIRFGDRCPAEGLVRVFDASGVVVAEARGAGEAVIAVPPSAVRYEVFCAENPGKSVLQAKLQFGDAEPLLSTEKPLTVAANSGRAEVSYSEKSPPLIFKWPEAPRVDAFELVLKKKGGKARRIPMDRAQHEIAAGAIADGEYEWWFEVAESDRGSPRSGLQIKGLKDAVANVEVSRESDGRVRVSGRAIRGARVNVAGGDVALDPSGDFRVLLEAAVASEVVNVRVDHPERGTHLFVRKVPR